MLDSHCLSPLGPLRQKTPRTKWLVNNKHLFLTVPEGRQSSTPAYLSLVSTHVLVVDGIIPCVLSWCQETGTSLEPFIRTLIQRVRALPSRRDHRPQAHLPIPSPYRLGFLHTKGARGIKPQSVADTSGEKRVSERCVRHVKTLTALASGLKSVFPQIL